MLLKLVNFLVSLVPTLSLMLAQKSDVDRGLQGTKRNTDGATFVVHRQPIALDRFAIHDIKSPDASRKPVVNNYTI